MRNVKPDFTKDHKKRIQKRGLRNNAGFSIESLKPELCRNMRGLGKKAVTA